MNAIVPTEQAITPFANADTFATAQRIGRALSSSSLVPEAYRGEDKLPNVLIALEVAHRIGASPLAVMQSLYIVHGRPSWSASFLIATVNACGRFSPIRFETIGDDPHHADYRVRAVAKDREGDEVCEGPWITWKLVNAEGWAGKSGSKWKSMPALMFMYRAAAFWTRVYAPELSLGIQTAEEVQDVYAGPQRPPESAELAELGKRIQARVIEHDAPTEPAEPEVSPKKLLQRLLDAQDQAALDDAAADIDLLPEGEQRDEIKALYDKRSADLQGGE